MLLPFIKRDRLRCSLINSKWISSTRITHIILSDLIAIESIIDKVYRSHFIYSIKIHNNLYSKIRYE